MIKYATIEDAKSAVGQWRGDPQSIELLGNFGNSVFSFKNENGSLQILRFTDPAFRSINDVLAELNFVNHLHSDGVAVANAVPNESGQLAVQIPTGNLTVSSVAYAEGLEVQEGSPEWDQNFFKEWGRNLAQIHRSSSDFNPMTDDPKRWHWHDEGLILNAKNLIPQSEMGSHEEFDEVMTRCHALPKVTGEFGLIHADHAPQNFRYEPAHKRITAFDFGNCCYHWFLSDLAISLSTIRRKSNREFIKENMLNGYSAVRSLPSSFEEKLDLFIRLRVLYVYLSRLHLWSENRTAEQNENLELLRARVSAKAGWK